MKYSQQALYPGKMFITTQRIYCCARKNDNKYSDSLEPQTLLMLLDTDKWFEQSEFLNIKTKVRCWIPYTLMEYLNEIV